MDLKKTEFNLNIVDVTVEIEGKEDIEVEKMYVVMDSKLEIYFDGKIVSKKINTRIKINELSLIKHIRENSQQVLISLKK